MAEIMIDASKPVDVRALLERLENPALKASANMVGSDEPVVFALAFMVTVRERDTLVAALRRAYPIAIAGG